MPGIITAIISVFAKVIVDRLQLGPTILIIILLLILLLLCIYYLIKTNISIKNQEKENAEFKTKNDKLHDTNQELKETLTGLKNIINNKKAEISELTISLEKSIESNKDQQNDSLIIYNSLMQNKPGEYKAEFITTLLSNVFSLKSEYTKVAIQQLIENQNSIREVRVAYDTTEKIENY